MESPRSEFFLILLSLFYHLPCVPSQKQPTVNCETPFQCGNITVGFPFSGEQRSSSCGHPLLKLSCDKSSNTTSISLSDYNYSVLHIDMKKESITLRLSRQDFSGPFCSALFSSSPLPHDLLQNLPSYKSLTVFYICDTCRHFLGNFTCPTNNLGSVVQDSRYDKLCDKRFSVTVPASYVTEEEALNITHLESVLRNGFEAKVNVDEIPCPECLSTGEICGFSISGKGCCKYVSGSIQCRVSTPASETYSMNLVIVITIGTEGSKRVIVYEFVENGSLDQLMNLDVSTLYGIALGVAKGIEYLHYGCRTRIVHFDIKPQNVLLDDNLRPKVSDFGLAKLCQNQESILPSLDTRGTIGYIAPELFSRMYGSVSYKSDVYSYGMLVLEMIGERNKERVKNLIRTTARLTFRIGSIRILKVKISQSFLGLCPSDRPTMNEVTEMMEGSLDTLKAPPKPLLHMSMQNISESSQPSGAIGALRKLTDQYVQADMISILTDKIEILTLEIFSQLVPVLTSLLGSRTERPVNVFLDMLLKLVAVFGIVIRSTVSAPCIQIFMRMKGYKSAKFVLRDCTRFKGFFQFWQEEAV
ncbi:hypothetical protein Bca4012_083553 [Brassica carinata]